MITQNELQMPGLPSPTIKVRDILSTECEWKVVEKRNYFSITGTFRKGALVVTHTKNVYKVDGKLVTMMQWECNVELVYKTYTEICDKLTEKLNEYAAAIKERLVS